MPIEVIMPKVDMDMSSGKIVVWHFSEGDTVEKGTPLFDIETDKAAMEVEAPDNGILHHLAEVGSDILIGKPVAWLYAEGEAVGAAPKAASAERADLAPTRVEVLAQPTPVSDPTISSGGKTRATPLARRMAREHGLEITQLIGSGPRGRIGKSDVMAALETPVVAAPSATASATTDGATAVIASYEGRAFTEVPLDGMRRTVATRLTEAKQTIPHFYLRREVRLDALMELRKRMNQQLENRGIKLTINDFIVKACAVALQEVPQANVAWAGDRILQFERSDLAVAVAVEGGLFTPIVRDADRKALSEISAEIKSLAGLARDRKLKPSDYTGGAMSISNLGMFGVDEFDAIINPPQGSILAVGAASERKVTAPDGTDEVGTFMRVTLSVDHRSIDGALGARFLNAIVVNLENPFALLA